MNTMTLRNHRVRFGLVDGEKYYHLIDICRALDLYVVSVVNDIGKDLVTSTFRIKDDPDQIFTGVNYDSLAKIVTYYWEKSKEVYNETSELV